MIKYWTVYFEREVMFIRGLSVITMALWGVGFSVYFMSVAYAANINMVWGDPHADPLLNQFHIDQYAKYENYQLLSALGKKQSMMPHIKTNELVFLKSYSHKTKTLRYAQYYQGIPVWGYQVIFHIRENKPVKATGIYISNIEDDIKNITPTINISDRLEKDILSKAIKPKFLDKKLIIYIDDNTKARLAYIVSFFDKTEDGLQKPHYIIDAKTGDVIKTWDGTHRAQRIGQGPGGNETDLDYRAGKFQYGSLDNSVPLQLGKFDVTLIPQLGRCSLANNHIEIVSFENAAMDDDDFPIEVTEESSAPTFSYPCALATGYLNADDEGFAPVRGAYSPLNDTMFFGQETVDMYVNTYNTPQPFGDNLPVRIYTHINDDGDIGSQAIDTVVENDKIVVNQQLILPNNSGLFRPETQSTVAHELSHLLTFFYSDLMYEGQSGGLNESFSDMAEIALKDYLNATYSWYWDGEWTIGREESVVAEPIRYLYDPPLDGNSIDNANDFISGMDPHYSSGVFNKAFYLLSQRAELSIESAFKFMIMANTNYWIPTSTYNYAACGVIQAAVDQGYSPSIFNSVFAQVGVKCLVGEGLYF